VHPCINNLVLNKGISVFKHVECNAVLDDGGPLNRDMSSVYPVCNVMQSGPAFYFFAELLLRIH